MGDESLYENQGRLQEQNYEKDRSLWAVRMHHTNSFQQDDMPHTCCHYLQCRRNIAKVVKLLHAFLVVPMDSYQETAHPGVAKLQ